MELNYYINLLKNRKQTVLAIVLLFLFLTAIFTVVQPFKYSSGSQLLIIQNFSKNTDPYTASKSNEYLSNILARVILSNSFYNNVLTSGFNINKNYFSGSAKEQMKKWDNTVSANAINDSGIIALTVYHSDRDQAEQIARAIGYTLQTKHTIYHGGGDNVNIKIIDEPITSNYPIKPNLIMNFILALVVGFIFSLIYIYLFPEEKFNIKLMPEKKKKSKIIIDSGAVATVAPEIKDNWQDVAQVLSKKFTPAAGAVAEEKINMEQEPDDLSSAFEPEKAEIDLFADADKDYFAKSAEEDIIGNGDIKNVFGKPNFDN